MPKIAYNLDAWLDGVEEYGWPARPTHEFFLKRGVEILTMLRVLTAQLADDKTIDLKSLTFTDGMKLLGGYITDATEFEPVRVQSRAEP